MKKAYKKAEEYIHLLKINKSTMLFIALLSAFILLHRLFELYVINFIAHYLAYVESNVINDIILIVLCIIYCIYIIIQIRKKYIPSVNLNIYLISLSIIYYHYRINNTWIYTKYSFINLAYLDIIILVGIGSLALIISAKWRKPKQKIKSSFFDDSPIISSAEDELGYSKYAKTLARKINNSHFTRSFAIGINGDWGSGKTSFINLVKEDLNKQTILIEFKAWNNNNPQSIIKDFFDTFQESISQYHSQLGRLLTSYSNKLVELNSNTLSQSIQASAHIITGFESIKSLFDNINESLKDIEKQIIITIDDVDRLDKAEIAEVIRLIRNTANFYNTVFIVAYDKKYINEALKQINEYNTDEFLEKIFQLEITLPYYNKKILLEKFAVLLKTAINNIYHEEIDEILLKQKPFERKDFKDWIRSARDVVRLVNSLELNLTNLQGEVDLEDFISLEILKLNYPDIYNKICFEPSHFLIHDKNTFGKYQYRLKGKIGDDPNNLEKYLTDKGYDPNTKKLIQEFIGSIFKENYSHNIINHNSVIYTNKFYRYFSFNLLKGDLSEIEFSKALELDLVELKNKIYYWHKNGFSNQLQNRLDVLNDYETKDDFEKIIHSLLYFEELKTVGNEYRYYSDGIKNIYLKINNENNIKKYYSHKNEYIRFIKSIFTNAKYPYALEINLIFYITYEYYHTDFILEREYLYDLASKYITERLEKSTEWNEQIFDTFRLGWQCTPEISGSSISRIQSYPDALKNKFKSFIFEKGLDGFLIQSVSKYFDEGYHLNKIIPIIFNDWDNFKKLLDEYDGKSLYKEEFLKFYSVCKSIGFDKYVQFDFKTMPITKLKA